MKQRDEFVLAGLKGYESLSSESRQRTTPAMWIALKLGCDERTAQQAIDHARDAETVARIDAQRVAAGMCRHCGGNVPCWSALGDHSVGKRHTRKTLAARTTP